MPATLTPQQFPIRPQFPQKTLHRQAPDAVDAQALVASMQQGCLCFWVVLAEGSQPAQVAGLHLGGVFHFKGA